ncbi:hypothetical protein M408DRAFT_330372 [Serendipita vermifera MAFF 305830]|uniref:Uncharacterized protein n=1 Tax=Serendipita vermifera MAFF 305830 TaxID=933852 RepID=A0A0C3B5L1_SERVB|nr:hypothetical protein M408DRAFT_330372 [Serendipita vermifera MAFF 305830]
MSYYSSASHSSRGSGSYYGAPRIVRVPSGYPMGGISYYSAYHPSSHHGQYPPYYSQPYGYGKQHTPYGYPQTIPSGYHRSYHHYDPRDDYDYEPYGSRRSHYRRRYY